ncbi:hypothetical protein ACQCVP_00275 [Rossellomorea vietnamensis]
MVAFSELIPYSKVYERAIDKDRHASAALCLRVCDRSLKGGLLIATRPVK